MAERYVAYANLGVYKSGEVVNPVDFGGEDSENWKYMVERRSVVPVGDSDAPAPPDTGEVPAPRVVVEESKSGNTESEKPASTEKSDNTSKSVTSTPTTSSTTSTTAPTKQATPSTPATPATPATK